MPQKPHPFPLGCQARFTPRPIQAQMTKRLTPMHISFKPLLTACVMAATALIAPAQALEVSGGHTNQTDYGNLKNITTTYKNAIDAKLAQLGTCNSKGAFYMPDKPHADADGCVGLTVKQTSFTKDTGWSMMSRDLNQPTLTRSINLETLSGGNYQTATLQTTGSLQPASSITLTRGISKNNSNYYGGFVRTGWGSWCTGTWNFDGTTLTVTLVLTGNWPLTCTTNVPQVSFDKTVVALDE